TPPEPPAPPAPPAPPSPPAPPAAPRAPRPPAPPTPPAPPSPPSPPAPPAPPSGFGDVFSSSHSHTRMQWNENGARYDVDLEGSVAFNDDLTDIVSMSDG